MHFSLDKQLEWWYNIPVFSIIAHFMKQNAANPARDAAAVASETAHRQKGKSA